MTKTVSPTLPNGYICPVDGVRKTAITLREADGSDEDFLNEEGDTSNQTAKFLARLIVELGGSDDRDYIRDVVVGKPAKPGAPSKPSVFLLSDLPTALIAARSLSEGTKYTRKVRCPECKKRWDKTIDLEKLRIETAKPEEYGVIETDEPGKYSVQLLDDHGVMIFRQPLLSDAKAKAELKKQYPKMIATMDLLMTVESIDGADPNPKKVQVWPSRVRNHMRAAMDSVISGVNLQIEHKCRDYECEHMWVAQMEMDVSSFFFKTEKEATSPTKTPSDESLPCLASGMTFLSWLRGGGGPLTSSESSPEPNAGTT